MVLGGPMLVVPTERTVVEQINDKEVTQLVRSDLYLLPAHSTSTSMLKLQNEPRYVGIYAVPVYLADVRLTGEFDFAALQPLLGKPTVSPTCGTRAACGCRCRRCAACAKSSRRLRGCRLKLGPRDPASIAASKARVDLD